MPKKLAGTVGTNLDQMVGDTVIDLKIEPLYTF